MAGGTVCRLRPKAKPASAKELSDDIAIGTATQLLVTFLESLLWIWTC
jgi:hypothetical protein